MIPIIVIVFLAVIAWIYPIIRNNIIYKKAGDLFYTENKRIKEYILLKKSQIKTDTDLVQFKKDVCVSAALLDISTSWMPHIEVAKKIWWRFDITNILINGK